MWYTVVVSFCKTIDNNNNKPMTCHVYWNFTQILIGPGAWDRRLATCAVCWAEGIMVHTVISRVHGSYRYSERNRWFWKSGWYIRNFCSRGSKYFSKIEINYHAGGPNILIFSTGGIINGGPLFKWHAPLFEQLQNCRSGRDHFCKHLGLLILLLHEDLLVKYTHYATL